MIREPLIEERRDRIAGPGVLDQPGAAIDKTSAQTTAAASAMAGDRGAAPTIRTSA
jgi:hypothetical protein